MQFQVLKDGKIMFQTSCESCIPPEEYIKNMKKSGYKIKTKKDGENNEERRK